jgi:hypothetical protein
MKSKKKQWASSWFVEAERPSFFAMARRFSGRKCDCSGRRMLKNRSLRQRWWEFPADRAWWGEEHLSIWRVSWAKAGRLARHWVTALKKQVLPRLKRPKGVPKV